MKVEIYSDVICPWCYIGKRRFEKALASFERRDEVEVVWRPYQLDPRAGRESMSVLDAYARKFGGPEKAFRIIAQLTETAANEGLDFNLGEAQRANTFDAHRVLWFAETEHGPEVQGAVKEGLLRAYFTEGRNVADHETLVAVAAAAGLDAARVRDFLASDGGLDDVTRELAMAAARGISAVPTFVVDGRWGIPGAQEPEVFLRVLQRMAVVADEERAAEACAIDDPDCVA